MREMGVRASCPRRPTKLPGFSFQSRRRGDEIAARRTITYEPFSSVIRLRYHRSLEGVVDDLHFEGDPARDSTRRRLERVMKEAPEPRSEWKWMAALAAGATALIFWQVRRRRRNGNGRDSGEDKRLPA